MNVIDELEVKIHELEKENTILDEKNSKLAYLLSQSVPVESSIEQYDRIKELEKELQVTREQLEKAEKIIEYYSQAHKFNDFIIGQDMEGDMLGRTYYGKRARQYFQDKQKDEVEL